MTATAAAPPAGRHTRYRFDAFELDPVAHSLARDGVLVPIQEHPFRLLLALLHRPREIVTRAELAAALWRPGTFVDVEHGLNTAIRKLRRGLGESHKAPRLLETVPRLGYRFLAEVETLHGAGPGSVAVLPFSDLSGAAAHLSDGLAEEMTRALSAVAGLAIAPRSAAFRMRDATAERGGLELGVRHLLTGQLRVEEGRCRVVCRLVEVATGRVVWTGVFDRRLAELLELEREVAREVVRSVAERLLPPGASLPPAGRLPASAGAYDLYLRALAVWRMRGHSTLRAVSLLERALALDADFAPAQQALAACYYSAAAGGHLPSRESALRLDAAARRALALAPEDGISWAVEGMRCEWVEADPRRAEAAYLEAIERSPGEQVAFGWMALLLASRGRFDEAVEFARRGHAIDVGAPPGAAYLGWTCFLARRYDEALSVLRPTADFAVAWISRAWVCEHTGRLEEALTELDAALTSNESRFARRERVRILAALGRHDEAQAAIELILESGALFPPFDRGLLALARGQREVALAELSLAHAELSPWMRFWRVDPRLDALRDDPGFRFPPLSASSDRSAPRPRRPRGAPGPSRR